jgi:hypothetical protein
LNLRKLVKGCKNPTRPSAPLAITVIACAAAALFLPGAAIAVSGAADTTDNAGYVGPDAYVNQQCLNGSGVSPRVNCNIYQDKRDVWLNGGPVNGVSNLTAGYYFFAVLSPGGQPNPNDGAPQKANGNDPNLSDNVDAASNRVFHVNSSGQIDSYTGTHQQDNTYFNPDGLLIQLFDYNDTPNPGGVYILAACFLSTDDATVHTVDPKSCKYDAFKVKSEDCTTDCGPPPADDLTVEKDATASFSRQFKWTVLKTVDGLHTVSYKAASKTLAYQVVYTKSLDKEFGFAVQDTITVTNPNSFDVTGVKVTDVLGDGTICTVQDGTYTDGNGDPQTVSNGLNGGTIPSLTAVEYPYSCSPSGASATKNTATATWDASNNLPDTSGDGSADVNWPTPTLIHNCVTASDTIPAGGIVGSPPSGSICDTTTFNYTKTVTIANACVTVNNTAAFVDASDITYTGSDSTTAQICGPITNGFTLGYWSNNNGRATLCAHDPAWRNIANASNLRKQNATIYTVPTTGNCTNAQANFATWILAANATNMSYMLSAQLIATTFDVAYKGMVGTACVAGINGSPISINNLFAGAVAFLASNGNTTANGPARTTATLYKNIFDSLNNNLVFAVPGPC